MKSPAVPSHSPRLFVLDFRQHSKHNTLSPCPLHRNHNQIFQFRNHNEFLLHNDRAMDEMSGFLRRRSGPKELFFSTTARLQLQSTHQLNTTEHPFPPPCLGRETPPGTCLLRTAPPLCARSIANTFSDRNSKICTVHTLMPHCFLCSIRFSHILLNKY